MVRFAPHSGRPIDRCGVLKADGLLSGQQGLEWGGFPTVGFSASDGPNRTLPYQPVGHPAQRVSPLMPWSRRTTFRYRPGVPVPSYGGVPACSLRNQSVTR